MDFPPELLRKIFSYQKKWWLTNDLRLIDIAKLWRIPRIIVCKTFMYQNNYEVHLHIPDSTKTYVLVYMEIFLVMENNRKLSYFAEPYLLRRPCSLETKQTTLKKKTKTKT
jgi:hypothetical protein